MRKGVNPRPNARRSGMTSYRASGSKFIGHAKGSVTSRYMHTLDSTLIMAADTVAGYP